MKKHETRLAQMLFTDAAAPELAEQLALYGRLVGNWQAKAVLHAADGSQRNGMLDICFGWILQGRAIQDVWTMQGATLPEVDRWFGTTLRVYDTQLTAWRIFWIDPQRNAYRQQIGRAQDMGMVQIGHMDNAMSRWSFHDVKPNSFHWTGELSRDEGRTWQLHADAFAERVAD